MKNVLLLIVLAVVLTACGKQKIASEKGETAVRKGTMVGLNEEINFLQEEQLRQQQLREEELRQQKRDQALRAIQMEDGQELEKQKQNIQHIESKRIFFDFDSFELNEEGRAILQNVANVMRGFGKLHLRVEGHCDERGTSEYNMALGERRARAVLDFLVVLGVDSSRLQVLSFGEENPLDTGHSESAWAMNRRAEFYFLK